MACIGDELLLPFVILSQRSDYQLGYKERDKEKNHERACTHNQEVSDQHVHAAVGERVIQKSYKRVTRPCSDNECQLTYLTLIFVLFQDLPGYLYQFILFIDILVSVIDLKNLVVL